MDTTEELDERSRQIIWRSVGTRSAVQIAKELGVTPEVVLRERQRMRDEIDVLTIEERQFKLLIELESVADFVREKLNNISDERNFSGIANSFVNAVKTINSELNALEKKNSGAVESLNKKRVQELLDLVRETVDITVPQIASEYGIDEDTLFDRFNGNLLEAAKRREQV